jgi:hypothetical protein
MEGQQQIQINLSNAPWIECDCGGRVFRQGVMFKKLSQFESPSLREEQIPVEIAICQSCEKIPSFVHAKIKDIPDELLAIKKIKLDAAE